MLTQTNNTTPFSNHSLRLTLHSSLITQLSCNGSKSFCYAFNSTLWHAWLCSMVSNLWGVCESVTGRLLQEEEPSASIWELGLER